MDKQTVVHPHKECYSALERTTMLPRPVWPLAGHGPCTKGCQFDSEVKAHAQAGDCHRQGVCRRQLIADWFSR